MERSRHKSHSVMSVYRREADMFAFNYAGASTLQIKNVSLDSGTATLGTNAHMAAFGSFEYVINSKSVSDHLNFTVTRTDGGVFTSAADLVTANSDSYLFAMHMADSSNSSVTGFAGAGTAPSPTPEPATLALLGTGLVALGGFARRFRK
jgi:hypothetical protein